MIHPVLLSFCFFIEQLRSYLVASVSERPDSDSCSLSLRPSSSSATVTASVHVKDRTATSHWPPRVSIQ